MDVEKFGKVFKIRMKLIDKGVKRRIQKIDETKTLEEEVAELAKLVYFLNDNIHDIKIDAIRNGIIDE